MHVGALELVHYWRLVTVFWANTFVSIALFFALAFFLAPTDIQESNWDEMAFIMGAALISTILVMYFGSFIWWPLIVLWHWAMLKLCPKYGFLHMAVTLISAIFFVLAAIAVLLQINWLAIGLSGWTVAIVQQVVMLGLWAVATGLMAGVLTLLAFWNTRGV